MKKPVKISLFALLFAAIALPVIAQQGGAINQHGTAPTPLTRGGSLPAPISNVKITPDFEKKLWCEVVHRNYSWRNDELNNLNDAARDRAITRLYELGFKLKFHSTNSSTAGEGLQTVTFTTYFFERPGLHLNR